MIKRLLTALASAALLGPLVSQLPAGPAQALQAPVAFTSAALSTWQANGVAWALASAQGKVFVGGSFTKIRPPGAAAGTNEQSRTNFAVFDAGTGAPTSCAPTFTNPANLSIDSVRALEVSPDGKTLYIGGYFSHVNGTALQHMAALDIASCTVISSFKPLPNGWVRSIEATSSTVYFVGGFTSAKAQGRARAAAVTAVGTTTPSSLLAWAPQLDKEGRAVALKPGGGAVVVGGDFDNVNGAASHALVVVNPTSGATIKGFPGFIPSRSVVKDLAVDDTGFYTANEGTGGGVFDGRIAVNWDYSQRWRDTCLGATQAVVIYQQVLYSGSHAHDCSSMKEFPDGPRYHFLAQSVNNPVLLPWFPNTNEGIGEMIGPRDMVVGRSSAGADYMWSVGEFTKVNGVNQQSITRFGRGPDTVGPSAPTTSVSSTRAGQVRVAWRQSLDTDDSLLTYRVYRDGSTTPIYTAQGSSWFWARRQMTFTDTTVAPGTTHSYKVTASDGINTRAATAHSVTVASKATSPYQERVLADGATFLWRYDEPSDVFMSDATSKNNNGTLRGSATYRVSGALAAGPSRALTLGGSRTTIYSETRYDPPATGSMVYTLETWFKTTTTVGGKIIGFGDKQTFDSRANDKHIFMTNAGKIAFGAWNNGAVTITSPSSYNNGAWHHVAATQGPSGMVLYVNGTLVARHSNTVNARFPAYVRVGGDTLGTSWAGSPTNDFWQGSLDETALYPTALSATAIAEHVRLGRSGG